MIGKHAPDEASDRLRIRDVAGESDAAYLSRRGCGPVLFKVRDHDRAGAFGHEPARERRADPSCASCYHAHPVSQIHIRRTVARGT